MRDLTTDERHINFLEEENSKLLGLIAWTAESLDPLKCELIKSGHEHQAFLIDTIIMKLVEHLPLE